MSPFTFFLEFVLLKSFGESHELVGEGIEVVDGKPEGLFDTDKEGSIDGLDEGSLLGSLVR